MNTEVFIKFAYWCKLFAMIMEENKDRYNVKSTDFDLHSLSVLFQTDMTPQQAAESMLDSDKRLITHDQMNLQIALKAVGDCNTIGSDIKLIISQKTIEGGSMFNMTPAPGLKPRDLPDIFRKIEKNLEHVIRLK